MTFLNNEMKSSIESSLIWCASCPKYSDAISSLFDLSTYVECPLKYFILHYYLQIPTNTLVYLLIQFWHLYAKVQISEDKKQLLQQVAYGHLPWDSLLIRELPGLILAPEWQIQRRTSSIYLSIGVI
jgi:hypothetical protein